MKNRSIITLILFVMVNLTFGKEKEDKDFQRTYTGGNASINIRNGFTSIYLSPILGYNLTPRFSIGPGITYQYNKNTTTEFHDYGGKVFVRYRAFNFLALRAEYEILSLGQRQSSNGTDDTGRSVFKGLFVGASYIQAIPATRNSISIMILYNLLENDFNPYSSNPTYRIGFNIGI